MEMELFSWYEFEGNVVFTIQNLQSMDLIDALIMVSQYIDEFGEEYIIEFIAESVGNVYNNYEFFTNLPYCKFKEANEVEGTILIIDGEFDVSKLFD